jgi:putative ABC transport system permease protein
MSFYARIANLFRRSRVDREIDDELRAHIEMRTEDNVRAGMSPEEARRDALLRFGNRSVMRERTTASDTALTLDSIGRDVRYALRQLRRSPGFTFVVLATLALGIGATTVIFSVVDAVMLKPLPFPTANRLVDVRSVIVTTGRGDIASYPDFVDWRARNHVFDGMAAFRTGDFTLIGSREPLHLQGAVVSAQLFSLLGVSPALGRSFLPAEDKPGAVNGNDPVILSDSLWRREFGGELSVLGRTIHLGDQAFTVIGVMPRAFQFPIQAESIELWTTIAVDARGGPYDMTVQRGAHYLDVIALLKPGVTMQQAQAEMVTIANALNKQYPENKPRTVRVIPELQSLAGDLRPPLLVLLGAVGCVLLMVCANVANLLLARATGRRKEMAVRTALGASRPRVICQVLAESLVLGLLGGGLGLTLAVSLFRVVVRNLPAQIPRLTAIGLDARLLGFAFGISLLAAILFGLAPALDAAKTTLTASLKEGGQSSGGEARGHSRLRAALATGEVALALVLLLGAGLLLQSFLRLMRVDPGFDPHHVLTFQLDAPAGIQVMQLPKFFREVVARISALPGVRSASAVASLPLTGDNIAASVEVEGQPSPLGSRPSTDINAIEPDYFRTVGAALLRGRDFTADDDLKSTPVAIVNQALARRLFPNHDPIGKHVRPGISNGYGPGGPPMREIVGVIGNVKQSNPGAEAASEAYVPLAQCPFDPMFIAVRTANDPRSIIKAARQQVFSIDKNAPLYHVKTLDQYFADSMVESRLVSWLLGSFATLAVLLACLGVYGVVSYTVAQRTHEIGVRMALGAGRSDLVHWVLRKGLALALVGVAIGLAGAFALVHLLSTLLFGIRATDPATFTAATLALLGVAALASYVPARRAASIDPMQALRNE